MLYTNLGRIVAVLAMVIGIWHIASGLMIATGGLAPEEFFLKRYFPGKSTTGAVIDHGMYIILFAIALGILTEISRCVRAQEGH